MQFSHAIARRPGRDLAAGITTSSLGTPDHQKAVGQFDAYVQALIDCGVTVTILDPLAEHPDAHFIEDTAVVVAEIAVITRPGAPARRGEVASVADALAPLKPITWIQPPGTLDGGDVLMMGHHLLVGLSDRTNRHGAEQLGHALAEYGYTWSAIPVAAGLHFKSSVNAVGENVVLTTRDFADHPVLADYERIVLTEGETYAGNTLLVNERLIMPAGYPKTREQLESVGRPIIELDTSEFRKMDGGLTCLSLRF
jgi:dimethylargininase